MKDIILLLSDNINEQHFGPVTLETLLLIIHGEGATSYLDNRIYTAYKNKTLHIELHKQPPGTIEERLDKIEAVLRDIRIISK